MCKTIYDDDVLEKGFHHYYLESENLIVISGTNSLDDWLRYNLKVFPLRPFHHGFHRFAERLYKFYEPYIDRNTTIIGSSAGGYLAFILASWCGCNSVSFGSPRLFSQKFIYQEPTKWPSTHLFITNEFDPIGRINTLRHSHPSIKLVVRNGEKGHKMEHYKISSKENKTINKNLTSSPNVVRIDT